MTAIAHLVAATDRPSIALYDRSDYLHCMIALYDRSDYLHCMIALYDRSIAAIDQSIRCDHGTNEFAPPLPPW